MVLVVSFSSCSKVDLNGLTGTYVGEACAGGFVSDSISGTQYVANCNQDFVKVIIDPDRDDKLRIVYNGNRDVTIDNNLNFDDSKGCTGKFNGDSLMINYEPNWTQSYWFRGKKQ
jgi:hypothetical protein